MKINSIYLENYRIHKETFIEFDRGINLLLGQNGKGKSSILEAIGITLFGSSFRDGNTKGQQQCIRYGEKEALIKIEFMANDQELYVIENQIKKSGGFNKLYRKNEPNDKITAKDEINEKLRILVGISGDLKDIYENIIVAKQNEFINSFKLKPTDRQKVFDKIFNTDIYRDIYEGQGKKVFDTYKALFDKESSFTEGLKQNLEDSELLKNELLKNETSISSERDLLKLRLINEKEVKTSIDEVIKLHSNQEMEKTHIQNLEKLLKSKDNELEKTSNDIKNGKLSLQILENNKDSYVEYLNISTLYDKQNKVVDELLKNVQLFNEKQLLQKEMSLNLESKKNQRATNKINIDNEKEKEALISLEIISLTEDLNKKEKSSIDYKNQINMTLQRLKEYEILEKNHEDLISLSKEKKLLFDKKSEDLNNIKRTLQNTDEITLCAKISELKIMDEEKNRISSDLNSIITRMKDNSEAKKELQSSICPYLKETCKNLQGNNADEFFINKELSFEKEKISLETKLNLLRSNLLELNPLEFELKNHKKLEADYKNSLLNLEKDHSNLIICEKDLEISKLNFEKYKNDFGDKESFTVSLTEYRTKLNALGIEEGIKTLENKQNQLNIILSNIKLLEEKNSFLLEEFSRLELEFTNLSNLIKTLESFPQKHSIENGILKTLDSQKKSLQEGFELYLSNEPIANKLPSLQKVYEGLTADKSRLIEELALKNQILLSIEEKISHSEKLETLKTREHFLKNEIENLNKTIGASENNINSIKNRIEKSMKINLEIEEKEKFIIKLSKKIELTDSFRKNIKEMGTKVSQNILEEISFWATDNFRKISGRPESVLWSNLENSYEVSLVGDKKITFEQLSGGEQVALAISLRGAMSSIFTKTNFSIFDEPTNNLDAEKRKSLADNIGEILKNLDQSIVVTHDDSFREMAQKVIEL